MSWSSFVYLLKDFSLPEVLMTYRVLPVMRMGTCVPAVLETTGLGLCELRQQRNLVKAATVDTTTTQTDIVATLLSEHRTGQTTCASGSPNALKTIKSLQRDLIGKHRASELWAELHALVVIGAEA